MTFDGQVAGEGRDAHVAAHYGSPYAEQRKLVAGKAVVETGMRVVTVTGPDRLSWLHSLTTQHLSGLQPGQSVEALLLTAEGRVEHQMFITDDGETAFLITEADKAEALAEYLGKMKFMLRVEIAVSDDAVIGSYADLDEARLTWADPWPEVSSVAYGPADHPADQHRRYLHIVSPDQVESILASHERAGILAWHAQRIADWRPSIRDVDEKSLPHEWDWLRTAVHLDKGCYKGQESVARIVNLGKPPRRLVLLQLDGSEDELPAVGAEVTWNDKVVGTVRAVARDMDCGPIALALLKRNVPEDAPLEAGEIPAQAETIVNPAGTTERSYKRPNLRR